MKGQQAVGEAARDPDAQPAYGFQCPPCGICAPARWPPRFLGDVEQRCRGLGDLLVRDQLGLRAGDLRGRRGRGAERQGQEVPCVREFAEARRESAALSPCSRCGEDLHCCRRFVGVGQYVAEQPQVDHLLAQVPCQPGLSQAPPRSLRRRPGRRRCGRPRTRPAPARRSRRAAVPGSGGPQLPGRGQGAGRGRSRQRCSGWPGTGRARRRRGGPGRPG